jgi:23S rRNA pseudouridine1911/1915/1917 synthase
MNERRFEITVPERKSRERLDSFLAREIPRLSRNKIQQLIRAAGVTVNDAAVKANTLVRPNDSIRVIIPEPPPPDVLPEDIPVEILFEDDYLLVVNKPAGMVVHPACGHFTGTLVNALLGHTRSLSREGGAVRPGIVHRLDKDTSGLLVVAKDDAVHEALAVQFGDKSAEREYRSVVWGRPPRNSATVETMLSRSSRDRRKIAVASTGKSAVTHYRVLERFSFLSHLSVRLGTGRTHQIRVHMSHIGHPVFGDPEYGGRMRPLAGLNRDDRALAADLLQSLPRQALHAKTLGFVHPVLKKKMLFDSELPPDIASLLESLRKL